MDLTISLGYDTARRVPERLAALRARTKIGPDTQTLIDVLEAVAEQLPAFHNVGDTVTVTSDWSGFDKGDEVTVEQVVNHGSLIVVASIDRETWKVIPVGEVTAGDGPG